MRQSTLFTMHYPYQFQLSKPTSSYIKSSLLTALMVGTGWVLLPSEREAVRLITVAGRGLYDVAVREDGAVPTGPK